jgi:hypothetical protein
VLVLKKLDPELEFQLDQVVAYLGLEEGLTVVVEALEYRRMQAAYGWTFLESFEDEEKPSLHQVIWLLQAASSCGAWCGGWKSAHPIRH